MKKTTKKTTPKNKPKYAAQGDLNLLHKALIEQRQAFVQRLNDQAKGMADLRAKLEGRVQERQISIRRMIACQVLNGMLSSPPLIDRAKVDKATWVRIAYEWADELIRQS